MSKRIIKKREGAERRALRTRARLTGDRPRLSIFRSQAHIYAQVIDDAAGKTLASSSDLVLKAAGKPLERAAKVGEDIAKKAIAAGVKQVMFDRGSYRYHGRVKAIADAAREAGLEF